jgi:hypothetical protein
MLLASQSTHTLGFLAVAATSLAGLAGVLGVVVLLLVHRVRWHIGATAGSSRTLAQTIGVKLKSEIRAQPADTVNDNHRG